MWENPIRVHRTRQMKMAKNIANICVCVCVCMRFCVYIKYSNTMCQCVCCMLVPIGLGWGGLAKAAMPEATQSPCRCCRLRNASRITLFHGGPHNRSPRASANTHIDILPNTRQWFMQHHYDDKSVNWYVLEQLVKSARKSNNIYVETISISIRTSGAPEN